jgi:hypothetical protein
MLLICRMMLLMVACVFAVVLFTIQYKYINPSQRRSSELVTPGITGAACMSPRQIVYFSLSALIIMRASGVSDASRQCCILCESWASIPPWNI